MGFDDAIGYMLEVRDGIFTGRSIMDGRPVPGASWMDKLAVLKRYIADHNMLVDLRNSTMIGDSEGDLPLLSFVGRPVAFNPSLPLARIARHNGWRIVVERKDAVYDIKKVSFVPLTGIHPRVPYGNTRR
jgi:fatty acyl-CoA reductase